MDQYRDGLSLCHWSWSHASVNSCELVGRGSDRWVSYVQHHFICMSGLWRWRRRTGTIPYLYAFGHSASYYISRLHIIYTSFFVIFWTEVSNCGILHHMGCRLAEDGLPYASIDGFKPQAWEKARTWWYWIVSVYGLFRLWVHVLGLEPGQEPSLLLWGSPHINVTRCIVSDALQT